MAIPTAVGGAPRLLAPTVYERGQDRATTLEIRLGPNLVTPSSASMTLYGPTGAVVASPVVTVAGSIMSATVLAAALPATLSYGAGYREEWACTWDGRAQIVVRDVWLARRELHCPVSQEDLGQQHPHIAERILKGANSVQPQIDAAWIDTLIRLNAGGQWPARIVEPTSLIPYMRAASLAKIWRALIPTTQADGSAQEAQARFYEQEAEVCWGRLAYLADDDQDGVADDPNRRQGPGGSVARSMPPAWGAWSARIPL